MMMRIRNKEEHKWVVSLLKDLSKVNKVVSRQQLKKRLSDNDYKRLEYHLGDYLDDKNPVYIYTKQDEISFQVRISNQTFSGIEEYEDAKDLYKKLKKGEILIDDVKGKKIKNPAKKPTSVTLEDGYKILMEKSMSAYDAEKAKYSSYTKKDSTIKYHILPFFKGKPLSKITEGDIERFVDQIRYHELSLKHKKGEEKLLSVDTQDEVFMFFKKLFKTTRRWFNVKVDIDIDDLMKELINSNESAKAKKQYNEKVGIIIENVYEDLNTLFPSIKEIENGIYNPIFGITLMIYFLGARIDEITALTPKDYFPESKNLWINKSISWHPDKRKTKKSYQITSTKTWEDRTILLPDSICKYLDAYISRLQELSYYSDDMYIYSRLSYARTDKELLDPFSLKTYDNHMRKAYIHSGLKENGDTIPKNHYARHAFNTLLEKNRIADFDRKVYLGHSPGMGVNEGYTHKTREEEKKIVELAEQFCKNFVDDD